MAWRPGPGQKPFALVAVEKERDDLRRTVCALQEEREGATLSAELAIARQDIRVLQSDLQTLRRTREEDASKLIALQAQVDALRQKPSVAACEMSPVGALSPGALPNSGSASDTNDGDYDDEGDDESDADATVADEDQSSPSMTVAAVHETLARGDWVIIGEHCFRSGYDGQMELVSPCELADEDVSWSKIRSYTDEELAQLGIFRGGKGRRIQSATGLHDLSKANSEYLAQLIPPMTLAEWLSTKTNTRRTAAISEQ
jgi:hypothetical protein